VDCLHDAHEQGKRILIEGANATMLDVEHGTYLHDSSSRLANTCRTLS
jgi:adenylosuccinate synthase